MRQLKRPAVREKFNIPDDEVLPETMLLLFYQGVPVCLAVPRYKNLISPVDLTQYYTSMDKAKRGRIQRDLNRFFAKSGVKPTVSTPRKGGGSSRRAFTLTEVFCVLALFSAWGLSCLFLRDRPVLDPGLLCGNFRSSLSNRIRDLC